MGVRGLASFVDEYCSSCLTPYDLNNTTVVVDGWNLAYALLKDCKLLNPSLGGNYTVLQSKVKDFIHPLRNCGVEPLIVLDGGVDCEGRKMKVTLHRRKERMHQSLRVNPVNQASYRMFPLLGKDVFVQSLLQMGVEVLQTTFEADDQIASLARKRGDIPVLSDDSDFFVYGVRLIPLRYLLPLNVVDKENHLSHVSCYIYNVDLLLAKFKISRLHLSLAASLVGNDYVSAGVAAKMFSQIKLQRKRRNLNEKHRRLFGLLHWLSRQQEDVALTRLLAFLRAPQRTGVQNVVLRNMDGYDLDLVEKALLEELSEVPQEVGQAENSSAVNSSTSKEDLKRRKSLLKRISSEVLLNLRTQGYVGVVVNAVVHRLVLLEPAIESRGYGLPAHHHCLSILQRSLCVILKDIAGDIDDQITLYGRQETKSRSYWGKFSMSLPFEVIGSLETEQQRLTLLLDTLAPGRQSEVSPTVFPPHWMLLKYCITFWIQSSLELEKSSSHRVNRCHVVALVLGALSLDLLENEFGIQERNIRILRERKVYKTSTSQALWPSVVRGKISPVEALEAKIILNRFFFIREELKTSLKYFDAGIPTIFSCLQVILYHALPLNAALGSPLTPPPIARLLDGAFFYTMTTELMTQGEAAIMKELRDKAPNISDLVNELCAEVYHENPEIPELLPPSVQERRNRKRRSRGVADVNFSVGDEEASRTPVSDNDEELQDNYVDDLTDNRFALLRLT